MAEAISEPLLFLAKQVLIITHLMRHHGTAVGMNVHDSYISLCHSYIIPTSVRLTAEPHFKRHTESLLFPSLDSFTILKGTCALSLLDHTEITLLLD